MSIEHDGPKPNVPSIEQMPLGFVFDDEETQQAAPVEELEEETAVAMPVYDEEELAELFSVGKGVRRDIHG